MERMTVHSARGLKLRKGKKYVELLSDKQLTLDALNRLAEYEDKSESGQFIELPCKVGDIYYSVVRFCNTDPTATTKEEVKPWDCEEYCCRHDCSFREYRIVEHTFYSVQQIVDNMKNFNNSDNWLLSKQEAEKRLKKYSGKQ